MKEVTGEKRKCFFAKFLASSPKVFLMKDWLHSGVFYVYTKLRPKIIYVHVEAGLNFMGYP
jgi:hypothetical protein